MRFKPKSDEERRDQRLVVRVNQAEREYIKHAADVRALDMSTFVRRAAMGRKADLQYEYQIVYDLRDVVAALKAIHGAILMTGAAPPEEEMTAALFTVVNAMNRITK